MAEPLKLFILAGEPSGDRIAADLVRRLRQRGPVELSGVGGGELTGEGLASLYPMEDLSVMGISDVLRRLPLLLWRVEQTARAILKKRPDITVLVDAQEFSLRVAKRLRRGGLKKPVLLYVAPSVWARHPERAKALKPFFDEVLAVLPFEPAVMARLEGPVTRYVGHPALAETLESPLVRTGRKIALLPGSRPGELRRHLPLLRSAAEKLAARGDVDGFYLPTLPALAQALAAEVAGWSVPVRVIGDRAERLALYAETALALTCAGTAALELALAGVPMVVTYVMDGAQARKFDEFGRPPVGLPNIILGETVTPEVIFDGIDVEKLIEPATSLLDFPAERLAQTKAFARLTLLMEQGTADAPREDPADRVLANLDRPQ
jgi:lipid-A-disaccharide synthase